MAEYYRRQFELLFGDDLRPMIEATNGRQLRVAFNITLDWGGYHSLMDLSIFNLSRDTEAMYFARYAPIALRAGYENRIDFVFQGQISNVLRERSGPDRITRIFARGGALELNESTISKTLGEGSALPEVIKSCADAMGLPAVINGASLGAVSFSGGYSMFGDPKKILSSLAKTHGFDWVVENNKIVIVESSQKRSGPVHEISALTGMEGSPEITEVGADVKVRLNPKMKIGQHFQVNSEFPQANFSNVYFQNIPQTIGEGTYKIHRIVHRGDSYGDDWTTELTGLKA